MAKIKTAKDLMREADELLKDAKKKQVALLREAKMIETKNLAMLGEMVVKYFNKESSLDDVKLLALELDFIEEVDKNISKESKDVKSLGEANEQL